MPPSRGAVKLTVNHRVERHGAADTHHSPLTSSLLKDGEERRARVPDWERARLQHPAGVRASKEAEEAGGILRVPREVTTSYIYIYPVYPNNPHVSLVHCLVTTQVLPPYIFCYDRTELDPPVTLSPHMTLKAYPFRHNDHLNFVMFTAVLLILRRDLTIPTTLRY